MTVDDVDEVDDDDDETDETCLSTVMGAAAATERREEDGGGGGDPKMKRNTFRFISSQVYYDAIKIKLNVSPPPSFFVERSTRGIDRPCSLCVFLARPFYSVVFTIIGPSYFKVPIETMQFQ